MVKTFKQFLKENHNKKSQLKEVSETEWQKIFDLVDNISDLADDARDVWTSQDDLDMIDDFEAKKVIEDLNFISKQIPKAMILLKKVKRSPTHV